MILALTECVSCVLILSSVLQDVSQRMGSLFKNFCEMTAWAISEGRPMHVVNLGHFGQVSEIYEDSESESLGEAAYAVCERIHRTATVGGKES